MQKIVLNSEALISSKNNCRKEKMSILFYTGAQSSFINKKISGELNLPIVRKERRFIQTFEDKKSRISNT